MKKIKLSVGVLAFIGLAALNFTQSESCLVSRSLAANTCCNDTITSSDDSSSSSTSTSSSTSSDASSSSGTSSDASSDASSGASSTSESSSTIRYGCEERECHRHRLKKWVTIQYKDENGNVIERQKEVEVEVVMHYEVCVCMDNGGFKSCKKAKCNTQCH